MVIWILVSLRSDDVRVKYINETIRVVHRSLLAPVVKWLQ